MKQFVFEIRSSGGLPEEVEAVTQYLSAHESTAVLVHVYCGLTEKRQLESVIDMLQSKIPEAQVVGASSGGEICQGNMTPQEILVVVSVFEKTQITVNRYRISEGEEELLGDAICAQIDAVPDIRAAELLVNGWGISTPTLFSHINRCKSRIKIFGAVPYAHDIRQPMYVFTGEDTTDVTVVVITYAGKDFHITTDYCIGWKPMGVPMTVTKADGKILQEIDHEPAYAVYDRYLQIPNDEHFYENAFEFPFLRYVNDTYMMRMPFSCMEDGSISLVASVKEGDTIFLSYGDISTILSEIYEARSRMDRFRPQYIQLFDCATRRTFWKRNIEQEIQPFQKVADTTGFFTGGEILRVNGELVHFNATLVVVGMREGATGVKELSHVRRMEDQDEMFGAQSKMVRRMAHFINVAMQELQQYKKK